MLDSFEGDEQSGKVEHCPFSLEIQSDAHCSIGITINLGVVLQNILDELANCPGGPQSVQSKCKLPSGSDPVSPLFYKVIVNQGTRKLQLIPLRIRRPI